MPARAALVAVPAVVAADGDRDGLPTVLLEAMALGTPCISTDVTGIPEVVRHEQTGLVVAQRRPDRLAQACLRLLSDEAFGCDLARRARELIESEFDIDRNCGRLRRLFARVASGGERP